MNLTKYISGPLTKSGAMINSLKPNIIHDIDEFNELARYGFSGKKLRYVSEFNHNISMRGFVPLGAIWSYLNKYSKNSHEFILFAQGRTYRFVFIQEKTEEEKEENMSGKRALMMLKGWYKETDALEKFATNDINEIMLIKQLIPKPMIRLTPYGRMLVGSTIENAFHIDINSAYPAGVSIKYPQFRPFFQYHYERRHDGNEHKAVMNFCIGACQSTKMGKVDVYPEIARAGIQWTVDKLEELTQKIESKKYKVLGYNTDGIFVQKTSPDQPIYTDEDEGPNMGQWKLSHVFEKLRFKSAGSYEFIENGIYTPKTRGTSTLERTKPREEWEWGDIFNTSEINYGIDPVENKIVEVHYGQEKN